MLKKTINNWFLNLKKEIRQYPFVYILLGIVLVVGLFLRVYRIDVILGFYFDQGRDGLVVWNLWHKADLPFIGPTTGIAGIFRGPYYYYLIAPFYLLGGGNPIWPSVFLSVTTMLAVVLIFYLGFRIHSRTTGLIAAIIASFSFNIVMASRWLSNPTPMLLLSMLLVWMMLLVTEGRRWAWAGIALVSGLSLFHFGSSGEAFYFLAIPIFFVTQKKNWPTKKIFIISLTLFFITLAPLILFDLKNKGLLSGNISKFLFEKESFGAPSWRQIGDKIEFLYDVFTNKIIHGRYVKENILLSVVLFAFVYQLHKLIKNSGVKILLLLITTGSLGIIFFQGNFGNIYDYYLTGYYLIFVLLFAIGLGEIWKNKFGKFFVIYFIYFFLVSNKEVLEFKLSDGGDGPNSVSFLVQNKAIEWIYEDAKNQKFNVDVYVPPVIPYAYDYLFTWMANPNKTDERVPLLYTLYEQDPPNPDRLELWLARQKGIGKVEKSARFGGITVERRTRIK